MNKIKVIIKRPGQSAEVAEIENTLEALQAIVGGYIETVTLFTDMAIICNEEGRIKGLPYNCEFLNIGFVGTILFVGVSGDRFTDIPPTGEKLIMEMVL